LAGFRLLSEIVLLSSIN